MPNEAKIENEVYSTAFQAAIKASELVLKYWPNPSNPDFDKERILKLLEKQKGTGNYATIADIESEKVIIGMIRENSLLKDHRIISEESPEIAGEGEWQWIIDPIDGTPPFKNGLPEFGVSIGILKGNEPTVGIIAMPAQRQLIAAKKDQGAFLFSFDGKMIGELKKQTFEKRIDHLLIGYDLGYENREEQLLQVAKLADHVGYPVAYGSSSTANFRLAQGFLGGYFCQTPTKFDIGAASCIIKEVGGVVSDIDGNPVDWQAESVSYLAGYTPEIHQSILKIIRGR